MKLISVRKFCRKMNILKSSLINAFKNSLIICLLKDYKIPSVLKKELRITLPYLGKMSQIVKTRLTKTMNKHMN